MHVISRSKLRGFCAKHVKATTPLNAWYRIAKRADWQSFAEVRQMFPSADKVGRFVVFNIGGNKYRLVATIHYNRGKVYIRQVPTHAEYDEGKWKDE